MEHLWILYADPSVHTNEVRLVKNAGLESFIHIQDIRLAPSRPEWLSVLPALADTENSTVYRGASCMHKLVNIELPPEHARRLKKKH